MMTSAQIVETLATTTDNSPSQDYTQPDDQKTLSHVTPPPYPRFKPLTVKKHFLSLSYLHFTIIFGKHRRIEKEPTTALQIWLRQSWYQRGILLTVRVLKFPLISTQCNRVAGYNGKLPLWHQLCHSRILPLCIASWPSGQEVRVPDLAGSLCCNVYQYALKTSLHPG